MPTPRYEYSRSKLQERIQQLTNLTSPYGLLVRYAVKANSHPTIISQLQKGGIHFDASSSYEAALLLELGIDGKHISLSSQQSPHNLSELLSKNVQFVATSFHQLKLFFETLQHGATVGIRINPDMGYGHNNRTSTGGVSASFGIWHEYIPHILSSTHDHGISINRLHIHVGSGADPKVWGGVMDRALDITRLLPDVTSLDIGGGYKVHRFGTEVETDIGAIIAVFNQKLQSFRADTGREITLEIEPGTYLIAHCGTLVAHVDDIVDTGKNGYTFLRLNTGMNDFLRSTMYGACHEIEIINDSLTKQEYIVVGHNCESGDLFTPAAGNPEALETRLLNRANIGDEVRIYDTGAYCASMRAKGYNAFPDAEEVFTD